MKHEETRMMIERCAARDEGCGSGDSGNGGNGGNGARRRRLDKTIPLAPPSLPLPLSNAKPRPLVPLLPPFS